LSGATDVLLIRRMWTSLWEKRTAGRNVTESTQPPQFFLLYFQTILAVIVEETNRYMQQDAQARNKLGITYSQQTCAKTYNCLCGPSVGRHFYNCLTSQSVPSLWSPLI
jgi:hypothetical protein